MPSAEEFLSLDAIDEMLRELVQIPSSNLDDRSKIASYVMERLEGWGCKCRIFGTREAPALLAETSPGGLVLSGHLDTVPLGGDWSFEQGARVGSKIYGRGAADMKGGCAAMVMAAAAGRVEGLPMTLVFTTDEETVMTGAEEVASDDVIARAPAIIICEPTSLKIGIRERGLLQLRITAFGKAAHASMPGEGDNAIHRILEVIEILRSVADRHAAEKENVIFNAGVIRGGQKVNVIPDRCTVEIDMRSTPGIDPGQLLEEIERSLNMEKLNLEVLHQLMPVEISKEMGIVRSLSSMRGDRDVCDVAFATEMVRFSDRNGNIAVLGPGDPRQAHQIDEHIDIEEVLEAAKIYYELASEIKG